MAGNALGQITISSTQCHIQEVWLLSRSQDTSLEGLPPLITPPDIFLVLFCPPQVVFLSFSWPLPIKMQANFPAH